MKTHPDTMAPRASVDTPRHSDGRSLNMAQPDQQTLDPFRRFLTADQPVVVARCPLQLNLMGGLCPFHGSLTLQTPLAEGVRVAVQRRRDGLLQVDSARAENGRSGAAFSIPVRELPLEESAKAPAGGDPSARWASLSAPLRCAVGAMVEGIRRRLLSDPATGFTVVADYPGTDHDRAGDLPGIVLATLAAAEPAVHREPARILEVASQTLTHWADRFRPSGELVSGLFCEPGTLVQVHEGSPKPAGLLRLPEGLAFVGLDCGVLSKELAERLDRMVAAAVMGLRLMERIRNHEDGGRSDHAVRFSSITITDYVECFRDRLPTRLKGSEFLSRFGEPENGLVSIDPRETYKIRSRAEHQIYEHVRGEQLVDCLSRAIRKNDPRVLVETGEIMYASHWSYGQRCGMGSVETDLLVNLVRQRGPAADLFGAKTSGPGGGGVVVVLIRPGERASSALSDIRREFESRTGRNPRLLEGTSGGLLSSGLMAHSASSA